MKLYLINLKIKKKIISNNIKKIYLYIKKILKKQFNFKIILKIVFKLLKIYIKIKILTKLILIKKMNLIKQNLMIIW